MKYSIDHIVLNVLDEEKMILFYTEVLNLTPERLEEYSTGRVPFPSMRISSDTVIDFFPPKLWQEDPAALHGYGNLNHFCISLSMDSWESLVARLEDRNIDIEEGPVPRWGAHGTGISIYFRDPDGNLIEARHYKEQIDSDKCLLGS